MKKLFTAAVAAFLPVLVATPANADADLRPMLCVPRGQSNLLSIPGRTDGIGNSNRFLRVASPEIFEGSIGFTVSDLDTPFVTKVEMVIAGTEEQRKNMFVRLCTFDFNTGQPVSFIEEMSQFPFRQLSPIQVSSSIPAFELTVPSSYINGRIVTKIQVILPLTTTDPLRNIYVGRVSVNSFEDADVIDNVILQPLGCDDITSCPGASVTQIRSELRKAAAKARARNIKARVKGNRQ